MTGFLKGLLFLVAVLCGCRDRRANEDAGMHARPRDAGGARDASPVDAAPESDAAMSGRPESAIERENRLPGSDGLDLTRIAGDELAGYTSAASAAPGESVELRVNVDAEQDVSFELFRIGDYQGHGARRIATGGPRRVAVQPPCPPDAQTGLVECRWASAFKVELGADWVTGYYLFKLTSAAGFQSYVPLIVREGADRTPILIQASVNTWQAYNHWGGTSLYRNTDASSAFKGSRATRVSFDRPYEATAPLFFKELPLVRWLEHRGYDASYTTNTDLEADNHALQDRRVFATVLHDEYWTVGERDTLDQARDRGVSLLFLSANTGYWRVRLDPSTTGVPRRIVTCFKSAQRDPVMNQRDTTDQFRNPPYARPENALIGVMWGDWSDFAGFPFVVTDPSHWIYAGTGVSMYDTLPPIIGVEWDTRVDNGLTPSGLEIIGDSPAVSQIGEPFPHAHASVYYPTPHSLVFGAGSINWINGLEPTEADPRVERMLENVMARAGFELKEPRIVEPSKNQDVGAPAETRVLAGTGEAGDRDGAAKQAQLSSPSGVAATPNGELYIADTGNDLLRMLDKDGVVKTVAGCRQGMQSSADQLCLDRPIGVAVDRHGTAYVSDSGHNRILRVDPAGQVSLYAGSGQAGANDGSDLQKARFSNPRGLAFGPGDKLYVADFGNAAIRCIEPGGVSTIASSLPGVMGVAVAVDDAIYVTLANRQAVGRVRDAGIDSLTDTVVHPLEGIMVDSSGVLIADASGYRVRRVDLNDRTTTTLFGDGRFGALPGRVAVPRGLTTYRDGYAVADSGNHRITWFRP
jgi:sugar lactone lactonase YvrE